MTVRDLIQNPECSGLRCVAGMGGLDRTISSVNILDNPDVSKFLKENELVLTTGYLFIEDHAFGVRILQEAARIGCVAIGMKVKRFFDEIPTEMCEEANRIGLPLLEIPFYYPFSDFSRIIFSDLKKQEFNQEQQLLAQIQSLSDLYFQDKSVEDMLHTLSKFLHVCTILTDRNLQILSVTDDETASTPAQIDCSDDLPVESGCAVYLNLYADGKLRRFCVVALPRNLGYLCIPAASELSNDQISLAEHAVKLLALCLSTAPHSTELRGQYDFLFEYLLSATEQTERTASEICHTYGISAAEKHVCICIQQDASSKSRKLRRDLIDLLSNHLPRNGLLFSHQAFHLIFLPFPTSFIDIDCVMQGQDSADKLLSMLEPYGLGALYLGIGRCYEGTENLRKSFQDALHTAYLARKLKQPYSALCYSHYLGRHLLLEQSTEVLQKICTETVLPLIESDRESHTELMRTLRSFFSCKLNVSAAAKQLFVHRNTLLGRLDRIRELLGLDLQDWEQLYSLYLGLCAAEQLSES